MPRRSTKLAGAAALLLLAAGTGCRSVHPEVPPARPYRPDGRQEPAVGFSSKPRASSPSAFGGPTGAGMPNQAGPGGGIAAPPPNNPFDAPPRGIARTPGTTDPQADAAKFDASAPPADLGPMMRPPSNGPANPQATAPSSTWSTSGGQAPPPGAPPGLGQPPALSPPSGS